MSQRLPTRPAKLTNTRLSQKRSFNPMQSTRNKHIPKNNHPFMKMKRQSKDNKQPSKNKTNPSSQNRRPTPKSSIQVPTEITNIKLNRPPITFIRNNPISHLSTNKPRGTQKHTHFLGATSCPTNLTYPVVNLAGPKQKTGVPRDTFQIISI